MRLSKLMQPVTQANTIEGRLDQSQWIGVVFLLLLGGLFPVAFFVQPPRKTDEWLAFVLMCFLLSLPCLAGSLYMSALLVRARIKADESGLHWRKIRRWKHSRWDEITDYYIQKTAKARPKWIIVASCGKLDLNDYPAVAPRLQAMVPQRACQSQAKAWELEGIRAVDQWPRVFTCDASEVRGFPYIVGAMFLIFPVTLWANSGSLNPLHMTDNVRQMFTYLTLELKMALALTLLAICMAYPLMMLAHLPRVRASAQRKGQRITADLNGITFNDGATEIHATWPEVTRYYTAPVRGWVTVEALFVVETKHGTFDFCGISNSRQLQQIISHYATNATAREWRSNTSEGVREDRSASTMGRPQRIYTYRTNTNRALLWLPSALPFLFPLVYWLSLRVDIHLGTSGLPFLVLIGCGALWLWVLYFGVSVTTDEMGISYRFLWRTIRLSWQEVKDVSQGGLWLSVIGSTKRVRFTAMIGSYQELRDEIAQRAVNSRTREWKLK